MMDPHRFIKGLLIDLEGVLYVDDLPIEGAIEAVTALKRSGMFCRFLTNTSTQSRTDIVRKLEKMGFPIEEFEIFTAPYAVRLYLDCLPSRKCRYVVAKSIMQEFRWVNEDADLLTHIIIGDIGPNWDYLLLNDILMDLLSGAELVAIHKNRFWQTESGLKLDIGSIVAALEYGSNKAARVLGKPSKAFFDMAVTDMGLFDKDVMVIGDDVDSDIDGAKKAGLLAALCQTGKFREEYFLRSEICPDYLIDSIADLPELVSRINGVSPDRRGFS